MIRTRRMGWAAALGVAVIGIPACKKKEAPAPPAEAAAPEPARAAGVRGPGDRGWEGDRRRQARHGAGDDVRPARHDLRIGGHRRGRAQQGYFGQVDLSGRPGGQGAGRDDRAHGPRGHRVPYLQAEAVAGGEIQSRDRGRRRAGGQPRTSRSSNGKERLTAPSLGRIVGGSLASDAPSLPDPLRALEASLADRYRFEREVGRGGMATVLPGARRPARAPAGVESDPPRHRGAGGPGAVPPGDQRHRPPPASPHSPHPRFRRSPRNAVVCHAIRRGRLAARPPGGGAAARDR